MSAHLKIIIAGASGYIGRALIPQLLQRFPNAEITALSRSQQKSDDPRVVWKACDLFSLKSLEEALPKTADIAFYLVHSMGPTAQLDQGSFADYDLILADNFARALSSLKLQQVIYLGGLIPETKDLSLHLQSRLEVEETFAAYNLPMTVFRAGLILGEAGSSFQILLKLVTRLPVMVCPAWTQTQTTPVDLPTVLEALSTTVAEPSRIGQVYDLAGCQSLTYVEMMRETARKLGRRRWFISVPFFTPTLSRLWVSLITNTSKDLVYPLIESLEHAMVARPSNRYSTDWSHRTYFELLDKANMRTQRGASRFLFRAQRKTVRSVQRLPLPDGKDADWVKEQYLEWLPKFLAPLIRVEEANGFIYFGLLTIRVPLLVLRFSPERSSADRQLLYIVQGFLVADKNRGRLEFRVVLNRRFVLAAIHDFKPALPWFIYRYTQARLHLLVMNAFAKFLQKTSK